MRVQMCEKAEEFQDTVPAKKSTLNQSDLKHPSLPQKHVRTRDPPHSHGHSDKKNVLKVENGITQRGRSASPKKSTSRHAEERSEKVLSPLRNDPNGRPRDRSPSPRKAPGQAHARKGGGRLPSPRKPQRTEGGREQSSAEARPPEGQRAGARAGDRAGQTSDGKETKHSQSGKHRTGSPERKSKRTDEKSLPSKKTSDAAGRVVSGKRPKPDPAERAVHRADDDRGRGREAADAHAEGGGVGPERASPARRAPVTPGPWKVPSAGRAAGTTGVAEKRL